MSAKELWVLPNGISELPPDQAISVERLRRTILDMFATWGYRLVTPPLVEFLDSLLVGSGNELGLHTAKITDQISGKMMGLRADITPQVARIEAHLGKTHSPDRLCYVGDIFKTRPQNTLAGRSFRQIGAELFGHKGLAGDIEIINLMLSVFQKVGINDIYLDLGHVGIFRSLVELSDLDTETESRLAKVLQKKSMFDMDNLASKLQLDSDIAQMLNALMDLHGGVEVIKLARDKLDTSITLISKALDDLEKITSEIQKQNGEQNIHFDLSELRGYRYHTGLVFAVYKEDLGISIAKGGRYDDTGKVFGRARPATGFSADLEHLASLTDNEVSQDIIFAPASIDKVLFNKINELREKGKVVIVELDNQVSDKEEMGCTKELVQENGEWMIADIVDE